MKKIATWLSVVSIIIFVITWGFVGMKLIKGDYDIVIGAYIGLIAIVIFFVSVLYLKITNRCQYCGKIIQSYGKYCSYCGKEKTDKI